MGTNRNKSYRKSIHAHDYCLVVFLRSSSINIHHPPYSDYGDHRKKLLLLLSDRFSIETIETSE